MKVALELQPCCGKRSGIGTYVYELAKRLTDRGGLEFCGNLFNFLGRDDNSASLQGITMPIRESRVFPYGVYRRIWNLVPISYQGLFPDGADLHMFFDYIVPPRISRRVITTVHDMTWLRFPEMMGKRNYRRLKDGMARSVAQSSRTLTFAHDGIELEWQGNGLEEKGVDRATGRVLVEVNPAWFSPTDVDNLWGDPTKAKTLLGWDPQKTGYEQLCAIMAEHDLQLAKREVELK